MCMWGWMAGRWLSFSSPINSYVLLRGGTSSVRTSISIAFATLLPCSNPSSTPAERHLRRCVLAMSGTADACGRDSPLFERPRLVVKKVLSKPQYDGDGAVVRRSIGRPELKNLDPFLMLDEFSGTSSNLGFLSLPLPVSLTTRIEVRYQFPTTPPCFETVTYMLQGAFTHQDFAGHKGTIGPGDLQWMTAGRGIIHSEMPAGEGVNTGLQLWINLSSKDKMIEPRYQELQSKDVSRVEKDGVDVRIIAGEAFGVKSPVYTRTPTMYLDLSLDPGAQVHQRVPEGWNAFIYVLEGEGVFGGAESSPVAAHHTLVLGAGDGLSAWNRSGGPLRFVLIGGQPLNEPVVQYGPFVMNTQAEIEKTIEDYHLCRNGFEKAKQWKSQSLLH
ncbi:hypothetical protein Taro_014933 [Colocasia esculenta]|uniref:Pirin-like protein n=1 Tax=Colocasia esculenta TaxID=4460 RepID=A0A843UKP0_COLES|nr:hypothetical protein [Colocasia esculenta]